jgi:hypothetical protein
LGEATDSPDTSSATAPLALAARDGCVSVCADHQLGQLARRLLARVAGATTLPRRRIVAPSQSARISSSLWEM